MTVADYLTVARWIVGLAFGALIAWRNKQLLGDPLAMLTIIACVTLCNCKGCGC